MRGCLEVPTAPLSCRPHAEWSSEIQSTMTKAGVACYLRQPQIERDSCSESPQCVKKRHGERESSVPAHFILTINKKGVGVQSTNTYTELERGKKDTVRSRTNSTSLPSPVVSRPSGKERRKEL
jgi:hypothetical protein